MSKNDVSSKFQKIYDDTYDYIYRYIMSKADTRENAEDLIQNVYLTFYRKMLSGATVLNPKHYLLRIAKNDLADHYGSAAERRNRITVENIDDHFDIPDEDALTTLEQTECTAYEEVMEQLKKSDITAFNIFMLHFGQGLTLKETAKALSMEESTVKTKMYRMLKKLQKTVKEDDGNALFRRSGKVL
ncbi:RNA polymerase sigma factor [Ruminococcus albus]|uniref:RNA polymerase, sigma-24 subunit, ECF subfamily n=1 Tax=Ruminococcus albus (strain ATCC 27210 / DSM 20455 / JCM 14654 / NCDO 2250 / 7) TaxID=697329 RepID=E6UKD6_RUMA7|nr:sigma-70 family RNA polymerase sigma factor [Ruminococcus albus]ADU24132.1 RNA polymerase, sigma-24 subunit, ECF subfamily [Ruminococcus albus 7 = DSM 20455]